MHFTPGLQMRVHEDTEIEGIDLSGIAEPAYNYVSLDTKLRPAISRPVGDDIELNQRGGNN